MRIMIICDDVALQEEAKARIRNAFPESTIEDSNPKESVESTDRTMADERIKLIALKDNHQIQTIFRRNRDKPRVRKPRTVISAKNPLAIPSINPSWFPKGSIVSVVVSDATLWENTKPFILAAMGDGAESRLKRAPSYVTAYSSSDVIIVMDDTKINTVAEDRFKVL